MTSFKKFFGPHATAILLSVLAATGMWYKICVDELVDVQYEIFVSYQNLSPKLMVTSGLVSKITLRLRGPEMLLRSITKHPHFTQVDLSTVKKGRTPVPVKLEEMRHDLRGFEVIDVQPPSLVITADNLVERSVPVKCSNEKYRKLRMTPEGMSIVPSTVVIKGPEATVSEMPFVEFRLDIDPNQAPGTVTKPVDLDMPLLVTATPSSVNVTYTLKDRRTELTRRVRVALDGRKPEDYLVEPAEIIVVVDVPESQASNANWLAKLGVIATPPALEPGERSKVPLTFRPPDGMTVLSPAKAEVTVTRRGAPARRAGSAKQEKQEQQDGEAEFDGEGEIFN